MAFVYLLFDGPATVVGNAANWEPLGEWTFGNLWQYTTNVAIVAYSGTINNYDAFNVPAGDTAIQFADGTYWQGVQVHIEV